MKTIEKQRFKNIDRRQNSIRSVLDSALTLFVNTGYDATSMDDIAKQATLTKGAVYFYFTDKLSLLDELLKQADAESIQPIVAKIKLSNGTARNRIVMFTNWFARLSAEKKELALLHVLISIEMRGRNNKAEAAVRKIYADLRQAITEVATNGQVSGEFSRDVAPEYQSAVVIATIDGLLLEWHRHGEQLDGRALAHSARNTILNGLASTRQPA